MGASLLALAKSIYYQREVGSRNIIQNKQTNKQTNNVFPVAMVTLLINR